MLHGKCYYSPIQIQDSPDLPSASLPGTAGTAEEGETSAQKQDAKKKRQATGYADDDNGNHNGRDHDVQSTVRSSSSDDMRMPVHVDTPVPVEDGATQNQRNAYCLFWNAEEEDAAACIDENTIP